MNDLFQSIKQVIETRRTTKPPKMNGQRIPDEQITQLLQLAGEALLREIEKRVERTFAGKTTERGIDIPERGNLQDHGIYFQVSARLY